LVGEEVAGIAGGNLAGFGGTELPPVPGRDPEPLTILTGATAVVGDWTGLRPEAAF